MGLFWKAKHLDVLYRFDYVEFADVTAPMDSRFPSNKVEI